MRVEAIEREREFIGDGFASERGACVKQSLDTVGIAGLDARHGQHERTAAAGGIAGHIEQILGGEAKSSQWTGRCVRHRYRRIGNKRASGIVENSHRVASA